MLVLKFLHNIAQDQGTILTFSHELAGTDGEDYDQLM
jgi:hypothetical protein